MQRTVDFRIYLQDELIERCKKNSSYSLRAFARFLHLEPSALSKILHGKRSISSDMFERIANRLGLGPIEKSNFQKPKVSNAFNELSGEVFQVISQWYHFAILELTYVEGFVPQAKWIAKALGISVNEATIALERLKSLGYLEVLPDGKCVDKYSNVTTLGMAETFGAARRRFQKELLEKAIDALENLHESVRDQTSITFSMNPDMLPFAKKEILAFRRRLSRQLQKRLPKREVYQLVVSLFPLSQVNPAKWSFHDE